MNKVIIIRGPLGVGKSTVSKQLAKKLDGEYFSVDQILKEKDLEGSNGIPLENFLKANKILNPGVEETLSSGRSAVIDGNFYFKEAVDDLLKTFSKEAVIFTLKAPVEVCLKRDALRENSYGEDSTRFVHMLVSKFDAGKIINTMNQTKDETVQEILSELK